MMWKTWCVLVLLLGVGTARAQESSEPISSDDERVVYALGARGRLLMVPGWMLAPFLRAYTTLTSGSMALELTRRKGSLDIVTSVDLGFYSLQNGNFLSGADDKTPELDTHYVQFDGLNLISLDVSFIYHKEATRWMEVFLGGGIGLGIVTGDIKLINNSSDVCTKTNYTDASKCYPVSHQVDPDTKMTIGPIQPPLGSDGKPNFDDPTFQAKLAATTRAQRVCTDVDCKDTQGHPYFHAAIEKPPVMPILNFIIGLRFKLHRHMNINVSGGFRDGWVFGAGPEVVF